MTEPNGTNENDDLDWETSQDMPQVSSISIGNDNQLEFYNGQLHLIWGGSLVGKTSLCLKIARKVIQKKRNVVYWDTENCLTTSQNYLQSVAKKAQNKSYGEWNKISGKVLENRTEEGYRKALSKIKRKAEEQNARLVVIDSIIDPIKKVHPKTRAKIVGEISREFKEWLDKTNTIGILTTQVWDKSQTEMSTGEGTTTIKSPVGGNALLHNTHNTYYLTEMGNGQNTTQDKRRLICTLHNRKTALINLTYNDDILQVKK